MSGAPIERTAVSGVDRASNTLLYRGYPATELAAERSFLDVAHLLWHGALPDARQRLELGVRERMVRSINRQLRETLLALPAEAHPMDVLRVAVSWLGATESRAEPDAGGVGAAEVGGSADREQALRLLAVLPTVVALDHRRRRGLDPIPPRSDLDHCANFFHMCFGAVPEPELVRAFEVAMVLFAEHGLSASTLAARVVASTRSDLNSAVTAAIGAVRGSLHGGANAAVMDMFAEIDGPDDVERWLAAALADERKVMGFGHRVYKHGDSRVPTLRAELGRVAALRDGGPMLASYQVLASAMLRERGMHPNLDFAAGPMFRLMGFDTAMFSSLFVMSRIVGWSAHVLEQRAADTLIRPAPGYTGPERRTPTPTGSTAALPAAS